VELDPALVRERNPVELSGGEQQRVGVARALAASPRLMLLDEPFGALDPLTRDRLQQSFLRIRRALRLTAIFVTHDMVEALLVGDRIGVMHHGRLVQIGTPADLLQAPADDYVRQLMNTPRRHAALVDSLLARGSESS
jgi:osmoprotectant transport system ATP-binding protein